MPEEHLTPKVMIYGAGGHARELRDQMARDGWIVCGFVDDFDYGRALDQCPVRSFDEAHAAFPGVPWSIAIGNPQVRIEIAERLEAENIPLATYVSADALVSPTARIERGAQVFARSIISSHVVVGYCSIVNFACVLSHDVQLDAFATISPGVHIAGNVHVETGVLFGVGSSVKNGSATDKLRIGAQSVIGAGACIVKNIPSHSTAIGVPGRIMHCGQ